MSMPARPAAPAEGEAPTLAQAGTDAFGFSLAGEALPAELLEAPLAETEQAPQAEADGAAVEPALPAEVAVEPPLEAAPDAEQWLLSMLGQRQASVQAREGEVAEAAVQALQSLAGQLPLRPQARQALPAGQVAETVMAPVVQPARADLPPVAAQGGESASPAVGADVPAPSPALAAVDGRGQELPQLRGAQPAAAEAAPKLEHQLRLQAPESKWGEQMLAALRDSVELQLQQKAQSATIRLDPPELGSLEILLSHDSGRLNVQISAAQGDVARLLQQTSERLRQELVGQNFLQVSVQVGADGQSGQHQQQARRQLLAEDNPGVAAQLPDAPEEATRRSAGGRDVLITV